MKTETLSIELLKLDRGTQARITINEETVADYAELIAAGNGSWPLGPLDVFCDGTDHLVADGFHRTLAAQRTKRASIPCRVHKGTARDARIFGMTANDTHGLRMSRADKRACVEWLLDCGEKMTQAEIAENAGVAMKTVSRIVAERKAQNETLSHSDSKNTGKTTETATGTGGVEAQESSGHIPPAAPNTDDETPSGCYPPILLDSLGHEIPAKFRYAHELGITLQSIGRELDKFRQRAKDLHEKPGGNWLRLQEIDEHVRALKGLFQQARYHTLCQQCDGKGGACKTCKGVGWMPDYLKGTI